MTISCIIEKEGEPFKPHKPYQFAALPRIGETVSLEWEDGVYPQYVVTNVIHVPDQIEDRPAFTVLHVRKAR